MADSRPRNQQWEPDDSGKISSKYDESNGHLQIVSLGKLSRKRTQQSLFTDKQKLSLLPQTDCKRISKGRTLLQKEGSKGRCEIQEKNEKQKKMCKRVDKIMMKLRRQMSPVGVTKKERGTFNSLYVGRECMTEVKYIHRSP